MITTWGLNQNILKGILLVGVLSAAGLGTPVPSKAADTANKLVSEEEFSALFEPAEPPAASTDAATPDGVKKRGLAKVPRPGFDSKKRETATHVLFETGSVLLKTPDSFHQLDNAGRAFKRALEVGKTVGVDFIVNVNLDKDLRLTRVFAGDVVEAHMKAYEMIKGYAEIPLHEEFDIVLTHSGYVGRDHYQTAKAGVGALPAVKQGGVIIIAANNRDFINPIGSPEYRSLIHLLKMQGPDGYLDLLKAPGWRFTKDQWEPEVWGKVVRKVGEDGLIYCSLEIERENYCVLPGVCGLNFLKGKRIRPSLEKAQEMVQKAILFAVDRYRTKGIEPTMAFIREGPYAVPVLQNRDVKP